MADLEAKPAKPKKEPQVDTIPKTLARMGAGLIIGLVYWWFHVHH